MNGGFMNAGAGNWFMLVGPVSLGFWATATSLRYDRLILAVVMTLVLLPLMIITTMTMKRIAKLREKRKWVSRSPLVIITTVMFPNTKTWWEMRCVQLVTKRLLLKLASRILGKKLTNDKGLYSVWQARSSFPQCRGFSPIGASESYSKRLGFCTNWLVREFWSV